MWLILMVVIALVVTVYRGIKESGERRRRAEYLRQREAEWLERDRLLNARMRDRLNREREARMAAVTYSGTLHKETKELSGAAAQVRPQQRVCAGCGAPMTGRQCEYCGRWFY